MNSITKLMRCFATCLTCASLPLSVGPAFAETANKPHTIADMATPSGKSTKAYKTAMDSMMRGMMKTPTGVADVDFASGMVPHHQGAIAMAEVELKYGRNAAMRQLAAKIITAQKGEIKQMKKWLAGHDAKAMPKSVDAAKAAAAPMDTMMQAMAITYSGNADVDFARGMIPHHRGAIDMAKVELQYGADPEIKKLAEAIKGAQGPEIKLMQDWLTRHQG
jgi:uncharacterized protein (DUF305 family)